MAGLKNAVVSWLNGIATGSSELQALMGSTVRMRYLWAQPNEVFPYLVHSIILRPVEDEPFVYQGQWTVDIWVHGPDGIDMTLIRDVLVALFHRRFYGTTEEGFRDPRMWLQDDGDIPQEDPRIWRTSLQFGIRLTASGDLASVLAREA